MASIKIPHFGMLDASAVEEYYDVDIEYNNSEIQIDLNFENKSIDIQRLETAKHFIDNIRIHNLKNRKLIEKDFEDEDGDTVRFYIDTHLEQISTDELSALIGPNTKAADQPQLLLKKLQLVRVGLYPDNLDQFAIFDYSIGKEITNHLVVLFTDANGNLDYMTMES